MRTRAQTAHRLFHSPRIGHCLEPRFEIALGLNRLRKKAAQ
jgi:hypothetical protein